MVKGGNIEDVKNPTLREGILMRSNLRIYQPLPPIGLMSPISWLISMSPMGKLDPQIDPQIPFGTYW